MEGPHDLARPLQLVVKLFGLSGYETGCQSSSRERSGLLKSSPESGLEHELSATTRELLRNRGALAERGGDIHRAPFLTCKSLQDLRSVRLGDLELALAQDPT